MSTVGALVMSGVIGLAITALLGFVIIPWLHKLKFGQTILDIGPNWHKNKQGTPTMGGIMFIAGTIAAIVVTVVTDKLMGGDITGNEYISAQLRTKLWAGLAMALAFGAVGFLDDYIKVVKKRNLGLTIIQKTIAQVLITIGYLGSIYMAYGGKPIMFVPFVGNVELGFFYWILGFCVIYGAINAVNFTDGIDGLNGSVTFFVCRHRCCGLCISRCLSRFLLMEQKSSKGVYGRHRLNVPRRYGCRIGLCC